MNKSSVDRKQPNKIVYLQTKILLAQTIIKTWDKAIEKEKKEIERWWNTQYCRRPKQRYGEFEKPKDNKNDRE